MKTNGSRKEAEEETYKMEAAALLDAVIKTCKARHKPAEVVGSQPCIDCFLETVAASLQKRAGGPEECHPEPAEDDGCDEWGKIFALRDGARGMFLRAVKLHEEAGNESNDVRRSRMFTRSAKAVENAKLLLGIATAKVDARLAEPGEVRS